MTTYLDIVGRFAIFSAILIASVRIQDIGKQLDNIDSSISIQTGQIDWLVTHYAKPVKAIFPWQDSKCGYCGSEVNEGDGPVVRWKIVSCYGAGTKVLDEKDKEVLFDLSSYWARKKAEKIAKERGKNVAFKFYSEEEGGLVEE